MACVFSKQYGILSHPYKMEMPDIVTSSLYFAEKEMATHSSILAWRLLWMEEPGRLLSIGSHRVGHD